MSQSGRNRGGGGGEPLGPGDLTPAACPLISAMRVPTHLSAAVNQKPQMESVGRDVREARLAMCELFFCLLGVRYVIYLLVYALIDK